MRDTISMENVFYNTFFKKSQLNQFKIKKCGLRRMNSALNSLCLSFLKSFNKMDIGCIISLYLRSSILTEKIQRNIKNMFFRRYRALLILGIVFAILIVLLFFSQQIKRDELNNQLTKVELQNVRIGAGMSNGVLGTAIFGDIYNKGDRIISIAEMNVEFLNEDGEVAKVHKFFPVNKFSFRESLPLNPGQSKEFGFPIDDIVPEDWDGTFTARLTELIFK